MDTLEMATKKEIQFSLIYRDMWQSSSKFQPCAEQLAAITPLIIETGCLACAETDGGVFEQVRPLAGENPNDTVRVFTKPLSEVGTKTYMLDRGLNGLRMYPVLADVCKMIHRVKHAQGVDITRTFDGLNDPRNIIPSIHYAKETGMTAQAVLCTTYSPIHTTEHYPTLADKLIEAGADEICLKDMAGIGRPHFLGQFVKSIKSKHFDTIIQYHGHSGPGFSVASVLEVCENGVNVIDVVMEPASWGKIHLDVITICKMLYDAGFDVPGINMDAYTRACTMTQNFIDDFLGYPMGVANKETSSLLVGCSLPGGTMGSIMADLKGVHSGINMYLHNHNEPELSIDDPLVKFFDEVAYVWPRVGYPPLVTPFNQYVKNIALTSVYNMTQGKGRRLAINQNMWNMILGRAGRTPGKIDPELVVLAREKRLEFFDADPQRFYPDALDEFHKKMKENGWEFGLDNEELLELAMYPKQYRCYRSGDLRRKFEASLAKAKAGVPAKKGFDESDIKKAICAGTQMIPAPTAGIVPWKVDSTEGLMVPVIGTEYITGQPFYYTKTLFGQVERVNTNLTGKLIEVCVGQGQTVRKGDELAYIKPAEKEEHYPDYQLPIERIEEEATIRQRERRSLGR